MYNKLYSTFLCLILIFSANAYAGKDKDVDKAPDAEKRSCIQIVDGYAYLSEDMSLKDTRAAAFANAKRQAVESAKTYIQSKTKVENFETKYDMVWSEAEGAVTILEQKDLGIEDNTRYHVWIKAEVEYDLKPRQNKSSQGMDPDEPLTVRVWTSKKHYKNGDNITIYMQGNRNFYARIVDITSTGDIIQLLPNEFSQETLFEGNKVYQIPGEKDKFELTATPPFGEDKVVVYASENPLGRIDTTPVGQGLSVYRGTQETLAIKTRGISVMPAQNNKVAGSEFYEATWNIETSQ